MIRRSESEYGKRIWAGVAKVAEGCPEWMKPKVTEAARRSAERIWKANGLQTKRSC